MMTVIRSMLLAAAFAVGLVLPAAAQQTGADAAATPPAAAEPAAPAAEAPATEAAPASNAPDMNAIAQKLQQDLQALTDAAREGARQIVTRETPYVISTDQLAAIAAGAIAGAIVIDLLGGGGLATLTGAAVGGVAGHWLYTNPGAMPGHSMGTPPANGATTGG